MRLSHLLHGTHLLSLIQRFSSAIEFEGIDRATLTLIITLTLQTKFRSHDENEKWSNQEHPDIYDVKRFFRKDDHPSIG